MKPWTSADSERLTQLRNGQEPVELDRNGKRIVLPTEAERTARREAEQYVRRYEGLSPFLLKLRAELRKPGVRYLTDPQLKVVATIREEEATGVRTPRKPTAPPRKPKVSRSRARGERKQRDAKAYNDAKLVIRRSDLTEDAV
jgi:hypothetical protein